MQLFSELLSIVPPDGFTISSPQATIKNIALVIPFLPRRNSEMLLKPLVVVTDDYDDRSVDPV